jgi:hypothetical protein
VRRLRDFLACRLYDFLVCRLCDFLVCIFFNFDTRNLFLFPPALVSGTPPEHILITLSRLISTELGLFPVFGFSLITFIRCVSCKFDDSKALVCCDSKGFLCSILLWIDWILCFNNSLEAL